MTAITATLHYPVISLRVVQAVPDVELERRRKQIRNMMIEQEVDLLIFHSMGGYLRYVTNYLGLMKPEYLILPAEAEMLFIGRNEDSVIEARTHFGLAEAQALPPSASSSTISDAEAIGALLKNYSPKSIGLVDVSRLPAGFYMKLKELLPDVKFQDATSIVDRVKMVKSLIERVALERSAKICDKALEACLRALQPGKKEYEVIAEVVNEVRKEGAEMEHIATGSGPATKEVLNLSTNLKNRMISRGDMFRLRLCVCGPGGYWTEISRTITLGPSPHDVERAVEQAIKVRDAAVKRLMVGEKISSIYNAAMNKAKELGCTPMARIIGYSQGLDVVEPPFIYEGVDEEVRAGMHFSIGCVAKVGKAYGQVNDNYVVTEEEVKRLQKAADGPLSVRV